MFPELGFLKPWQISYADIWDRALEELLVESEGDGNGYRIETKAERFVELLTGVERPGGLPAGRELEWYIQQAYEDLAFLLRPVL